MYAIALYGVLVGLTAPVGHTAVVDSNADTASSITVLVDSAGHGKGTGQETGKSGQGNRGG